MPISAPELAALNRLLEQALEMAAEQRQAWFDALPNDSLKQKLGEMLAQHAQHETADFLCTMPKLADEPKVCDALARAGDQVGPYRLIRQLGQGGMGTVWLADRADGTLRRQVALKMPLSRLVSTKRIERFARERDVLSALAHPGIARLYDAGVTASGQPFIVLEHVDGRSITQVCDESRYSIGERLKLFLQVLDAVDHAHKHLVVHRDLKPSNILVGADAQIKLLDFGIAKLLEDPLSVVDQTALTMMEGCAMTPRYAAPEQIDNHPISTATDVYSLGVVLYELLTGQSPYELGQSSISALLYCILKVDPVRPSAALITEAATRARGAASVDKLRTILTGDLDTIVLKALRKAPGERYQSVERLAEDIAKYIDHRPIAARRPSMLYAGRLLVRRHWGASVVGAVGMVAAMGLAALTWQQHTQTLAQMARADAVRNFMLDLFNDAEPAEGQSSAEVTGKDMIVGAIQRAHIEFADKPQLQGEVLSELGRMYDRLEGSANGGSSLALETLSTALKLLQASASRDDPALNKTRTYLATAKLAINEATEARTLSSAALAACVAANRECAKARAYANGLLSQISLREGRIDDALTQIRRSVRDMQEGFGPNHLEVSDGWLKLAMIARNAGELLEANEAIDRALNSSASKTLRAADRMAITLTKAVLDLDLGRFDVARITLTNLVSQAVDRGERALLLRLLANAHLALGNAEAARSLTQSAIDVADPAEKDTERLFALQAHARADSLLDHSQEAFAGMQSVIDGLLAAGYAPTSVEVLRAHRLIGEMRAREGDFASAWSELEKVRLALDHEGARREVELGQALDLEGCVKRMCGDPQTAKALHERARELLVRKLPIDHPFLKRNAIYRKAAEWSAKPSADLWMALKEEALRYRNNFDAKSMWPSIIDAYLLSGACPSVSDPSCRLIL
jgi:eukaryotic-like serine/threonine-protein kinase